MSDYGTTPLMSATDLLYNCVLHILELLPINPLTPNDTFMCHKRVLSLTLNDTFVIAEHAQYGLFFSCYESSLETLFAEYL